MSSFDSITPVILAAGDSRRMGYPKALLPLGAEVFLTRILSTVRKAGLGKPKIVLGKAASVIQPRIEANQADILINRKPERGQLSSIQLAVSSLKPGCIAAMIWPVDQPLVSMELICSLVKLFLSSDALIAHPVHGGKSGHPSIFRKMIFPEILETPLGESPKKIVMQHKASTAVLPTDETGTVCDIDTPSDYENAIGVKLKSVIDPHLLKIG
jgi:molybdenum cofactor cytidylyltransferase